MRVLKLIGCTIALLAGCATRDAGLPADTPVHTLTLRWQRLVDESQQTCPRCASTEQEVGKAFAHLKASLAPAGIAVALETDQLDEAAFLEAPLESNRIWIDGRPLEEWLGAQTASSSCSGCCGDNTQCRTVAVGARTYEAIPAGLIVRAALVAAGHALRGGAPVEEWSPPILPAAESGG